MIDVKLKTSIKSFNKDLGKIFKVLEYVEGQLETNRDSYLLSMNKDLDKIQILMNDVFDEHFTSKPSIFPHWFWEYGFTNRYGSISRHEDMMMQILLYDIQEEVRSVIEILEEFSYVLPELDSLLGKESILESNNVIVDDIIYLILSKLFSLKDEKYYPIIWILEGNGIKLKRGQEELSEIIAVLDHKFIKTQGNSAQITIKGEIQLQKLERARKRKPKPLKEDKIDAVILELKKLGIGQEILFNELDELKKLQNKIGKKNWGQLVKGKVVDLFVSEIIDKETAQFIISKLLPDDSMLSLGENSLN